MKDNFILILSILILLFSCKKEENEGCTDPNAINYNANANIDDGSCISPVNGCMDPNAYNYNANANTDNSSCIYDFIQILTLDVWILNEKTLTPGYFGQSTTDLYAQDSVCHTDNTLEYRTTPEFIFYEIDAGTTCDVNLGPNNEWMSGYWSLNNDTTKLIQNITSLFGQSVSLKFDWDIQSISDHEFIISRDTFVDGMNRILTEKYIH